MSTAVERTSNVPLSTVKTVTSRVPPPKSKMSKSAGLLDPFSSTNFLFKPYARAAAKLWVMMRMRMRAATKGNRQEG